MRDALAGVVWDALRPVLADRRLDIVDAGGGTGGFAVPLARLGHAVTVVDPTPDSLAALERRAAEAGVTVTGIQGDAGDLGELLPPGSADLVLCHSVLEYVEDPAAALAAAAGLLRPGGALSVLAANPVATAVHRALAGNFGEARRALADTAGRWGEKDPTPHRFTPEALTILLAKAAFTVGEVHGAGVFADLVPDRLAEADPDGLAKLERAAAVHPVLRDIATRVHVLAYR
ncbi:methyltransferase domain-containing protein [Acrocarpospora catenulata]|uniref:methyltransferase domain-containing protein n=1 Tax=Acrocarpospora catenulata TaxID=2836182 RepID=UPI001BD9AAD2|nr:methyltransferase domain-containing protein [Acrocarpospora catenulata]